MKKELKDLFRDLRDGGGYAFTIGVLGVLENLLYKISKSENKIIRIGEWNPYILRAEQGLIAGSMVFLGYKLVKEIYDRHKLK